LIGKFLISIISTVRPQTSRRSPAAEASAQEGEMGLGEYLEKAVAAKEQQKIRSSVEQGEPREAEGRHSDPTAAYGGLALPEGNHVDG
jgi:hypothetical protein